MNEIGKELKKAIELLHDIQCSVETAVCNGEMPQEAIKHVNHAIDYSYALQYYVNRIPAS